MVHGNSKLFQVRCSWVPTNVATPSLFFIFFCSPPSLGTFASASETEKVLSAQGKNKLADQDPAEFQQDFTPLYSHLTGGGVQERVHVTESCLDLISGPSTDCSVSILVILYLC